MDSNDRTKLRGLGAWLLRLQPALFFVFCEVNLKILFINIKAAHCTILQPRFFKLDKGTEIQILHQVYLISIFPFSDRGASKPMIGVELGMPCAFKLFI